LEYPEDNISGKADTVRVRKQIWQSTFLDISLLLLSFFVIIAGIARFSIFENNQVVTDRELYVEQQKSIHVLFEDLTTFENELQITLNSTLFYKIGETRLTTDGIELVLLISSYLKQVKEDDFLVDIEGHTDDRPINSSLFDSNWDLSAMRASNVVELLVEDGFDPRRLKATGYADSRPFLPNRDVDGNPIEEHMDKNRRFDIRIYY